jgi:tyrosine-protein kinase Etk/Wzc
MQKKVQRLTEEREDNLIQQVVSKYLPYWPLLLIAMFLGLLSAYIYLRYTTPMYEAAATLIIKDDKKGTEASKMDESLNTLNSKQLVENEIEVLQSRSLMDSVVDKLMLYAPIYEKGSVHSTLAYLHTPVVVQFSNTDSLQEVKKISLSYDKKAKKVTLNNSERYPINEFVKTPFGRLKFIPNKYYKDKYAIDETLYFSLIEPQKVVGALLPNLEVTTASKMSTIIDIKFKDEVPERAEDIVNELLLAYDKSGIKTKNDLARNTLAFLDERLALIGHQMDSLNKKVQQYKSGAGAVDIGSQGQIFLQNVGENDQKLSTVNSQIAMLSQVESSVSSKGGSGSIVPSTFGISDPMLTQMMERLYTAELEKEKLSKTVGENNPNLVALNDQINKIRPNILENIRSQKQSLGASRSSISAATGGYNSMLRSMPGKERELLNLTRDQSTTNGIYQFLLQKKEDAVISSSNPVSGNRIVDFAKAGGAPVSPKNKLIYGISIFAFLLSFLLFIAIRELFTGKVLYRKEIDDLTQIPIIAEIAFDKTKNSLVVEPGKRTFAAEEFRKIRVSLSFLGIDDAHKKILVTSSISGEGKSFVAANLAISIASTGKKVVLVDMDLNNPTIGKILNINQPHGVSDYLMGTKNASEIIQPVKAYENLSYISAGTMIDNPSELMVKGNILELVDYLDGIYDVVLIDTSPVVLVTDAFLLSGHCTTTLYIVRHKYTPRMVLKRIDENNKINPLHNPAIIFNGVKGRGFFKNSYGHGYGYNYVYGYNKTEKK